MQRLLIVALGAMALDSSYLGLPLITGFDQQSLHSENWMTYFPNSGQDPHYQWSLVIFRDLRAYQGGPPLTWRSDKYNAFANAL
jgi:hypothetical protein